MSINMKRLFVGNLPVGVSEAELEKEFNTYGQVEKVELKRKENLVDPGNPLLFAFVNINIEDKSLQICLDEFSRQKFRGQYLNVSVARESFLDRLKREREEASGTTTIVKQSENISSTLQKTVAKLPKIVKKDNGSSSSSESSESEDEITTTPTVPKGRDNKEGDDQELFISKKRASSSLFNGKITIHSARSEPIHVISRNQKDVKHLNEQAKVADQKRKESLNKMQNHYNQQKLAIQKALADVDAHKRKKIIFDDEEEPNGDLSQENQRKKNNLFDDDEGNDEDVNDYQQDFEVKEQFLGRSGEKLMKLQSKYNLDRRFQLDERFIENEDGENNEIIKSDSKPADDERSWQLGIIEQVVGRKFETLSEPHKKKLKKTMLRYDPGKEEHQKFLQNVEAVAQTFKSKKRNEENNDIEVSKEQFYSVNEDLTKSLKSRGDGFSLISMFGKIDEDIEKPNTESEHIYEEKVLPTRKTEGAFSNNVFKYDSSESEDEKEFDSNMVPKSTQIVKEIQKVATGTVTKQGIKVESFFILGGDERLKEGRTFFEEIVKRKDGEADDYDKVKDRLRQLINKKIVKSKKGRFKNRDNFKKKY